MRRAIRVVMRLENMTGIPLLLQGLAAFLFLSVPRYSDYL